MAPDLNLSQFFKGNIEGNPGAALQEIIRAILIRTQFLPAVRHVIGLRAAEACKFQPPPDLAFAKSTYD
jgi:hypothetical protein